MFHLSFPCKQDYGAVKNFPSFSFRCDRLALPVLIAPAVCVQLNVAIIALWSSMKLCLAAFDNCV